MEYIITLDIGTMSTRAIIYDSTGNMVFSSAFEYTSIYTPPSLVEQDPQTWKYALQHTLKEAGQFAQSKGLKISAISVTSQRASVIPVDEEGTPLYNAIMWQDKRTVQICDELLEKISMNSVYRKTGLRANPYFSLPKMIWFKINKPEIYAKSYKLIGVQDYVVHQLTGEYKTDWTQAARTMLMNIKTFSWDREMIDISGVDPDKLCELCPPGAVGGCLTKEMSNMSGLPEGMPIIIAGGDQQNAAIALNIIKPGIAEANTGTGSFVIAFSNKPVFDKKCRVLCSASAIPGKWIVEAGIFNTGSIFRWFREQFYAKNNGENLSYKVLDEEAAASPVGSNGVMLLPHFEGSAAPFWNPYAKGLFFNLSLGTKRGDIARSILEGISMEIADNISLIETIAGEIDTVSVAGGMTKSNLFNSIQANTFYKSVIRYPNSEASSLGATISAFVTIGTFKSYEEAFKSLVSDEPTMVKPVAEDVLKYDKLRLRKHTLYNALNQKGVYEAFMKPI